jgi:RNA polymerase sigma-70 factor (ECF subfamily)
MKSLLRRPSEPQQGTASICASPERSTGYAADWHGSRMSDPRDRDAMQRELIERDVRAHCVAGERDRAATLLLESYGPEIFRFVMSRLRDEDAASEVFSQFTEDLWRGLGGFQWQCAVRVWSYTLARHAASRYIADARRRRAREAPLSHAGRLSELGEKIRTQTLVAMRTESKKQLAQLRERLPVDDQSLVLLRVTRKLSWKEIARVMFDDPDVQALSERELDQAATRLRQRFQVVKEKLREMAREGGLVFDRKDEN